jgi:ATP-dependent protease ClpP protease subunit
LAFEKPKLCYGGSNGGFQMPVKYKVYTPAGKLPLEEVHTYSINTLKRELYLHGFYGTGSEDEEPGVEYRMATIFTKNIHLLESAGRGNILIHMHTIGGNWFDGMAIFNVIQFCKSPTTILAYGEASSMSSIILQSATKRVMIPDTDFMIHYGTGGIYGHVLNVISEAELEKRITARMLRIYAKRCINGPYFQHRYKTLTEEKVMEFLERQMKDRHDWWMSAEEAVYYGMCDGIFGEKGFENIRNIRTKGKK